MPCLLAVELLPNRIEAWTMVSPLAAGVNVYLLSIRAEVQPPETDGFRYGMICNVSAPLN
jgi:hypothetical protein